MKFYIGSGLQNGETVSWYAQRLKEHGWEHAFDWTQCARQELTAEDLARYAAQEQSAVKESDVVIILLPGGRGTHVELGMALALGKRIFLCADGEEAFYSENAADFYLLPGVGRLAGTPEENLKRILDASEWEKQSR